MAQWDERINEDYYEFSEVTTMEGQEEPKKRKAASLKRDDDEGDDNDAHSDKILSVKVEHEDGENATLVVPPDVSDLSPIHRILFVDLRCDDENVVEKKLKELADLCRLDNDNGVANREVVRKAGGAFLIVVAMRKWYNNPEIQIQGCIVLANAAFEPTSACMKAFCLAAKEAGAFKVVVSAMKNYPDNCFVQVHGCAACGNLCFDVEENANHFVNTINGLDRILAAMRKFPDDANVQRNACFSLRILSERQEFRPRIRDIGGRQALVDAIDTHKDETKEGVKELQKLACKALRNLL